MTTKTPVYHRTIDGRKVVILEKDENGYCKCYVVDDEWMVNLHETELIPWVDPETRTVYVHWWATGLVSCYPESAINRNDFKAIKKITITEGEFDE